MPITSPPTQWPGAHNRPHDFARCGMPRKSSDKKPQSSGRYGVKGEPCAKPAGSGTNHRGVGFCYLHQGNSPSPAHQTFNARLMTDFKARRELARFGMHVQISPSQALLAMVHEAAGNVATLGGLIDEMNERERQRALPPIGAASSGVDAAAASGSAEEEDLFTRLTPSLEGAARTFVGPLVGSNPKTGRQFQQTEQVRSLVVLYGEWADRLVKYSKAALDAGVAKAQVEIAKKQAEMLVAIVRRVLDSLHLSAEVHRQATLFLAAELRRAANVRIIDTDMPQLEAYAGAQLVPTAEYRSAAKVAREAQRREELG